MCKFDIRSFNLNFGILPHVHVRTHTHASCNAVPLVWGSLRLVPIIATIFVEFYVLVAVNLMLQRMEGVVWMLCN